MRRIALLVTLISTSCSSVGYQISQPELSPSYVNEHIQALDGAKIAVKGWLILEPGNVNIWDSEQAYEGRSSPAHCLSLLIADEYFKKNIRLNHRNGVVTGKVLSDIQKEGVTMLSSCNMSGVVAESLKEIE